MSDTTAERLKLLEKVKKMLELADPERGGTQGEIENSARMAKMLMDKYNISLAEVLQEKKDDPNTFSAITCTYAVAKLKQWHWALARAIDRIVGTRHYSMASWGHSERRKRDAKNASNMRLGLMCFFGVKEQVEIACGLYDKWCDRIDRMATAAVSDYIEELEEEFADEMLDQGVKQIRFLKGLGERHPNTWRTGWLDGCLSGINSAISEEEERARDEDRASRGLKPLAGLSWAERRKIQEAEKEEETAPVMTNALVLASVQEVVEEKYKEHSRGFRSLRSQASRNTNYSAFDKGQKVGKGIRLGSKELGGG